MKLLSYLIQTSPSSIAIAACTALVAGGCDALFVVIVHRALSSLGSRNPKLMWEYGIVCLVSLGVGFIGRSAYVYLTHGSMFRLLRTLTDQILAASLRKLEEAGKARLITVFTEDLVAINGGVGALPLICLQIAVLVCCLVYLGYLSRPALIAVLTTIIVVWGSCRMAGVWAEMYQRRAREDLNDLFRHLGALIDGIKELKLNRPRRGDFLRQDLHSAASTYRNHNLSATVIFVALGAYSQLLFSVVIGLLLFVLPVLLHLLPSTVIGYMVVLLYMVNPLGSVVNGIPNLTRANVAFQNLISLGLFLSEHPELTGRHRSKLGRCSSGQLMLQEVTHEYYNEDKGQCFKLGPIAMSFGPGQLIFIMGGNGSGKTTLAKLITGLYPPNTGQIYFDGVAITEHNLDDYRQRFSVVFSDPCIFEGLPGIDEDKIQTTLGDCLKRFGLERRVRLEGTKLRIGGLSQGQRKRLALITAVLEDRPIYVFDEWAADQEFAFKEFFYLELLPELKARAKLVLVITHDDHYSHVADRVIKLNGGIVEYDSRNDLTAHRSFPDAARLLQHSS